MTGQEPARNLAAYMNWYIRQIIRQALHTAWRRPRETAFLVRQSWALRQAGKLRLASEKSGRHLPPFLIASITSRCNLFCKGCYARANQICSEDRPPAGLTAERWGEVFSEAQALGISFMLLAGGEPLLSRPVLEMAAASRKIIFPVFTNGVLLDDEYTAFFDRNRHLIPVLSLEGDAQATDQRRGEGTYKLLEAAMARLKARGIFFGTSVTLTSENLQAVASDEFCLDLIKRGCSLLLYVEYIPVDSEADAGLAPDEEQRQAFEGQLEQLRRRFGQLVFLSFPGDEKLSGGCLAAGRGFFHINSDGGAEPCPFSPFSDTSLQTVSLAEALESPLFRRINEAGLLLGEHSGGCKLFEHEAEVRELAEPKP
jgi:MoaA/NifB/PqqE/SkfB family radical SAM enzyme